MLATERARGHRCAGSWSSWRSAVVAFVAAIAIQRNVFPFYSGDHDEPVYRFQAEMLRDGAHHAAASRRTSSSGRGSPARTTTTS